MAPQGAPMTPPGMMINPAFMQWTQLSRAWHAEKLRRDTQFLAACHLIRHDVASGYKIDIEADSTVAADEQAEKAARTEFLQSILPMLQLLIPQAQQNPGSVPLIHALVMFGVRAFPSARSLEQNFEEAFKTLLQSPPQPPPQKGNTKSPMEIQTEAQIAAGEQQTDQQSNQVDMAKLQMQMQMQQQKNAIDLYKSYMTMQSQQAAQQQDAAFKSAAIGQDAQEMQAKTMLERARLTHLISRDTRGLV
jgi:hypothetical protein